MTITVYRSDDASAPAGIANTAGRLIAVLDGCLVNGYTGKAAAGWTKEFSGTNKAVYRAPSGKRFRLRIDDTGTTFCRALGYVDMTDVDTGTEPFPTAAQVSGGGYIYKSSSATASGWIVIATETYFYLWINYGTAGVTTPNATATMYFFGDFDARYSDDDYNTAICIHGDANSTGSYFPETNGGGLTTSGQYGHYVARGYLQAAGAKTFGKVGFLGGARIMNGTAVITYPNPVNSGLDLRKVGICDQNTGASILRGYMPGLMDPLHNGAGAHLDTFSGRGDLVGQSYILISCYRNSSGLYRPAFRTA